MELRNNIFKFEEDLLSYTLISNNKIGGERVSHDIKYYNEGISRKKVGDTFIYYYIKTQKEVSKSDLARIHNLKLPPAWTDLWISTDPEASIQAIGIDVKGRKQYKYHETHIQEAEKEKFLRLFNFIKAIPNLEKIIQVHSKLHNYHKNRVIVTMLSLVKELHMRVGKEQYARENKSYGISSLKKKHMKIIGDLITFRFKGKSSQRLFYSIRDDELKSHLQILLKLEGDKLFQYIDDNNKIRKVTDTDLNDYIQTYMGYEFSIKDFRTYGANYYFTRAILSETSKRRPVNEKSKKKNILRALKTTAHYLKHTKAISKKSYVMNFTIEMYQNNPEWFIDRKNMAPNDVLLDILKQYKKNILRD
jgi:DNA topoisomerase I